MAIHSNHIFECPHCGEPAMKHRSLKPNDLLYGSDILCQSCGKDLRTNKGNVILAYVFAPALVGIPSIGLLYHFGYKLLGIPDVLYLPIVLIAVVGAWGLAMTVLGKHLGIRIFVVDADAAGDIRE